MAFGLIMLYALPFIGLLRKCMWMRVCARHSWFDASKNAHAREIQIKQRKFIDFYREP